MSSDHKWKHDGVRVIPGNALDGNTPQTPGMDRKAAINFARVGAQKIWAGTVAIQPNAKTGALIVVTWPKVKKGLGFPARAFAILP